MNSKKSSSARKTAKKTEARPPVNPWGVITTKTHSAEHPIFMLLDSPASTLTQVVCDGWQRGARAGQSEKTAARVLFDGTRETLQIDAEAAFMLEEREAIVIALLVEKSPCTLKQLRAAGVSHPERVLNTLIKKYPRLEGPLTIPGRKGKGGYRTTITARQQVGE